MPKSPVRPWQPDSNKFASGKLGAVHNLGSALTSLGERESGTARLEEAVAAYRAALEEWTRERVPFYWAGTQNNLGEALEVLADCRGDPAILAKAIACMAYAVDFFRDGGASYWLPTAEDSLARMRGKLATMTTDAAPGLGDGASG